MHLTGLIKPDVPHAKIKFPAAEAFRGVDGRSGHEFQEFGPVILRISAFGTVFTQPSLIAKVRPDLIHLPTTIGEHCIGDGINMGKAVGAMAIDLEWVQVHLTGLVKPGDP